MRKDEEAVFVEETGVGSFQVSVRTGETAFFADEPISVGGLSSGPDPFELVGAALASCTVMTVRLYARRKGWPMRRLSASVRHSRASASGRDRFDLLLRLDPELDADQQARLLDIANRCPVHRLLAASSDIVIETGYSDLPRPVSAPLHARAAETLCRSDEPVSKAA
ncbi:OsmC family protein [Allosphingosinicella deserti]|nr:OsmC family protein [Sphingomonas deserti]